MHSIIGKNGTKIPTSNFAWKINSKWINDLNVEDKIH